MITPTGIGRRFAARSLLAGLTLVASAVAASAQSAPTATDPRWSAWIGCWQPAATDLTETSPYKQAPVVCVVPAAGTSAVELMAFVDGRMTGSQVIDASGTRREATRDECSGWERAEWSATALRVYLRSEFTCEGGIRRESTGIMSISSSGEWLDVQGVGVGTNSGVRVVHYREVPVPPAVPQEFRPALERRTFSASTARVAAGESLRIADVIEATKRVDVLVAQTWLAERGQGFGLDAKKLIQLADAGVPKTVIDVMVALSYPRAFALNLARSDGQVVPTEQTRANAAAEESYRGGPVAFMNWDPFYSSCSGYDYYGYASLRNRHCYGLGLGSPLGYPGSWWYPGNRPVIVTRPSGNVETPRERGRMVKGRGYTRPGSGGDQGSPRTRASGDDGSRSSGGSADRSSGSSRGGSTGRKASPRSP